MCPTCKVATTGYASAYHMNGYPFKRIFKTIMYGDQSKHFVKIVVFKRISLIVDPLTKVVALASSRWSFGASERRAEKGYLTVVWSRIFMDTSYRVLTYLK